MPTSRRILVYAGWDTGYIVHFFGPGEHRYIDSNLWVLNAIDWRQNLMTLVPLFSSVRAKIAAELSWLPCFYNLSEVHCSLMMALIHDHGRLSAYIYMSTFCMYLVIYA
jgi:hypothetical protein